jgi:hypothetical protein
VLEGQPKVKVSLGSQTSCWEIWLLTAFNGIYDLPCIGTLQLDGVGLVGDRELARTTAVDGSVRAAVECELERERATGGDLLAAGAGKGSTVTWEVAAARFERVLHGVAGDRLRLLDVHVSIGDAQEGCGNDCDAADGGHGAEVEHFREVRCG